MALRIKKANLPPASLVYGGKEWSIQRDNTACEDMEAAGFVEILDQGITYSSKSTLPMLQETILHEFVHVLEATHGLYHFKEQDTQTIANGILTMLKDNPEMTAWLLKEE